MVIGPTPPGTGVIAGGSIRTVLELAGVKNILSKQLGSNNLLNNARATIDGLSTLIDYRYQQHFKAKTGRPGAGKQKSGAAGDDIILKLPVGTQILDESKHNILADLTQIGQKIIPCLINSSLKVVATETESKTASTAIPFNLCLLYTSPSPRDRG